MSNERPKRWYRFSLKTLLIVVTLSCVPFAWIGWRMQRARENRVTLAADQTKVAHFGGTIFRDPTWLEKLFDDPGGSSSGSMVRVSGDSQFTDAGLEHLKSLSNLTHLGIDHINVTDEGLEHLKGVASLRWLSIGRSASSEGWPRRRVGWPEITDAGLEHLKGITNLQFLSLWDTGVTDAGLEHLKGLTNLETLILYNTRITDKGVMKLQQALPNCKVYLYYSDPDPDS